MRSSLAVRRSRTRNPTISFSVSSLGTATSCTQVSPRATLRTHSTSAALVTLRYTTPWAPFDMCFSAFSGFIGAHHSPLALDGHMFLTARHLRGQRNFKFNRRTNLHGSIGADVHARSAEISRDALGISGFPFMNLDRQFQRKSFSGPCFFPHGTSSMLAGYDGFVCM